MPNRILREGILTSERVNALTPSAEIFYRRLMSAVDDFGRIEAHPTILLARCYPLQLDRVSVHDVSTWLAECAQDAGGNGENLVTVYAVAGKKYLQVNKFGQRERTSKYPSPKDADKMLAECAHDADTPHAYARAPTPTPTPTPITPSPSTSSPERTTTPEVSLSPAEESRVDLLENLLGLFIALGRGMGNPDRVRCENHWKGLTVAERIRAHDFAIASRAEWQTRPTNKIPQPWNFLSEKHWERAAPRLLPQTREPSKSEDTQKRAAERFRAEAEEAIAWNLQHNKSSRWWPTLACFDSFRPASRNGWRSCACSAPWSAPAMSFSGCGMRWLTTWASGAAQPN